MPLLQIAQERRVGTALRLIRGCARRTYLQYRLVNTLIILDCRVRDGVARLDPECAGDGAGL